MKTAKDRLKEILPELKDLRPQTADPEKAARFIELNTEAQSLRTAVQADDDFTDLEGWAGQSAGRISLAQGGARNAEGADLLDLSRAGETIIHRENVGRNSVRYFAEEYGDGIYDAKQLAVTASREYKDSLVAYIRSGGRDERISPNAYRLLNEASDVAGGYLVPEDLANMIIMREPAPTRLAARTTQLQTSRDTLAIPRVNYSTDDKYTTGIRVSWTGGETGQSSTTHRVTDPTFGRTQIPIFTAMMSLPLSLDMIEDSAFPLLSFVADKFGETVELLREDMAINGTGVGQPRGMINTIGAAWDVTKGSPEGTILYVPSTTDASIGTGGATGTADPNLTACAMSIPEQYDANSAWCFNKQSTGMALAQLRDGNGRKLWGSGLQDSGLVPGYANKELVGYPTFYSAFMPNIASASFPMLFGDFKGHFLVNRVGFSIQILRERYAEENQVVVLGRLRFGGATAEPFKLRAYRAYTS